MLSFDLTLFLVNNLFIISTICFLCYSLFIILAPPRVPPCSQDFLGRFHTSHGSHEPLEVLVEFLTLVLQNRAARGGQGCPRGWGGQGPPGVARGVPNVPGVPRVPLSPAAAGSCRRSARTAHLWFPQFCPVFAEPVMETEGKSPPHTPPGHRAVPPGPPNPPEGLPRVRQGGINAEMQNLTASPSAFIIFRKMVNFWVPTQLPP